MVLPPYNFTKRLCYKEDNSVANDKEEGFQFQDHHITSKLYTIYLKIKKGLLQVEHNSLRAAPEVEVS